MKTDNPFIISTEQAFQSSEESYSKGNSLVKLYTLTHRKYELTQWIASGSLDEQARTKLRPELNDVSIKLNNMQKISLEDTNVNYMKVIIGDLYESLDSYVAETREAINSILERFTSLKSKIESSSKDTMALAYFNQEWEGLKYELLGFAEVPGLSLSKPTLEGIIPSNEGSLNPLIESTASDTTIVAGEILSSNDNCL